MPRYDVQGRIRTLAHLYADWDFELRGIHFSQWEFKNSAPKGRAWLARATIVAEDVDTAYCEFQRNLIELTDRIAFVSQCYTAVEGEPSLILPLDNNPGRTFFFNFSCERGASPLGFGSEQQETLRRLEDYEERGNAFRLLREACNSPWFYTRFSMLASALEAIAGEGEHNRGLVRNKDYIRDVILKDPEVERLIFKPREGVRNRIFHGRKFDDFEEDDSDIVARIFAAIKRYFREEHGIDLKDDIVRPMRTPSENFHGWRQWLKPNSVETDISLKPIWELAKSDLEPQGGSASERFYDLFASLPERLPDI